MKKMVLILLIIGVLAGCSGKELEESQVGETYQEREGFVAEATIVANLGDYAMTYTVEYKHQKNGEDTQTILKPEEIAGIAMTLTGEEEGLTVSYEDTVLETAMPDRKGLTPVDGIYYLISQLRAGYPSAIGEEKFNEQDVTHITYQEMAEDGELRYEVYLEEDQKLHYAEVYAADEMILQITATNFEWME